MTIIDDPLLALIMRFVIKNEGSDAEDEAFIQTQIQTLQSHLEKYPELERGERALQWIETHAENYRREWQLRTLANQATTIRCADCPLVDVGSSNTCEIHDAWLELLNRYMADEIDSRRYVEKSLKLLQNNKQRLSVRYELDRTVADASGLS